MRSPHRAGQFTCRSSRPPQRLRERRPPRGAIALSLALSLTACSDRRAPPANGDPIFGGVPSDLRGRSKDDYERHVEALRKHLPRGFTIVIEPPFVVVGDERPAMVKQRAERLVRWSTHLFRKDLFDKDPKRILDVWLFKDEPSYRQHTLLLFGERPSTPFGYYSSFHGALIMNIATGGGTLVHEIVHPFVEEDFPGAPPWLNEGLGSLYERSMERDGHIVGLVNWRLAEIQKSIREGALPHLDEVLRASEAAFYEEDGRSLRYAMARYLCYYLQERGLLVALYRGARAQRSTDKTGIEALKKVLGEPDLARFQPRWESFVAALTEP